MKKYRVLQLGTALTIMMIFCASMIYPLPADAIITIWASEFRPHGAYIDEVVFVMSTGIDEMMLALKNGDIDAFDERVQKQYVTGFLLDSNIEVNVGLSANYRILALNSGRFPTNITGYRRAMAFGMDKNRTNIEIIDGAGIPLDSYFSTIYSNWEVESNLTEHFYDADFAAGNVSLYNAGFKDLDGDGWREYDKNHNGIWDSGTDLDDELCSIEITATAEYDPAIIASRIALEGLESMGMHATIIEKDWTSLRNDAKNGDHWATCWTEGPPVSNLAKRMYDNFRTGASRNSYFCFSNDTIDDVLDKMVTATILEDVKKYSRTAARLLVHEQPMIVCYNDVIIDAYRTDKFTGFCYFTGQGITQGKNPYVVTKVRLKDGSFGGTFKYCLSEAPDTLNVIKSGDNYETVFLQYVYESLWNTDPMTLNPIPGLAYAWDIEETRANGDIQDGQKFTFYLYDNATWHDGQPLTSTDVKYSFETVWPQSPLVSEEVHDIYRIDTPDNYTVEIYVNKTGYFDWISVTDRVFIIPKHIWQDVTNLTAFNPTDAQMIGSGPYKWNTYVPDVNISLIRNPDWHFAVAQTSSSTLISQDSTNSLTTSPIVANGSTTLMSTSEILLLLTVIVSLVLSVGLSGYYLLNPKFKKHKSFIEFIQSDQINFFKSLYHKVIIGLENISTAMITDKVETPHLKPVKPKSMATYFPSDIQKDLKSGMKTRTVLTLIEIAYQYADETNPKILSTNLEIPLSTLSGEIKRLTELNYIEYHASLKVLQDGRYRNYIVTPKGVSFLRILKGALELSIRRLKEKNQADEYR